MNLIRKSATSIGRVYRRTPLLSLLSILTLLIVAALIVRARISVVSGARAQSQATATQAAVAPVAARPQGNPDGQRIETELVTITTVGFEPSNITRPQGSFFLEVDNRSGLSEVDLRLDAEHGNRLHQKRVPREQLDWLQQLDLRPGRYLLTEANHPEWVCRITITAR